MTIITKFTDLNNKVQAAVAACEKAEAAYRVEARAKTLLSGLENRERRINYVALKEFTDVAFEEANQALSDLSRVAHKFPHLGNGESTSAERAALILAATEYQRCATLLEETRSKAMMRRQDFPGLLGNGYTEALNFFAAKY